MITILTSCTTGTNNLIKMDTVNFCEAYKPMLPSRQDTKETAQYLIKNYKLWETYCNK